MTPVCCGFDRVETVEQAAVVRERLEPFQLRQIANPPSLIARVISDAIGRFRMPGSMAFASRRERFQLRQVCSPFSIENVPGLTDGIVVRFDNNDIGFSSSALKPFLVVGLSGSFGSVRISTSTAIAAEAGINPTSTSSCSTR